MKPYIVFPIALLVGVLFGWWVGGKLTERNDVHTRAIVSQMLEAHGG